MTGSIDPFTVRPIRRKLREGGAEPPATGMLWHDLQESVLKSGPWPSERENRFSNTSLPRSNSVRIAGERPGLGSPSCATGSGPGSLPPPPDPHAARRMSHAPYRIEFRMIATST